MRLVILNIEQLSFYLNKTFFVSVSLELNLPNKSLVD